jgi:eukaryotic-like serine/threonine-protein kinase
MTIAPGTRLGAYEVLNLLGAGGMGEVYRARDAKLQRDVALKILPELFAADPERRARFTREAHVLASLNHPHIGSIYGIEEASNTTALVLELVEGPTLAERIAQGPIPTAEALKIALQIADALDAAHEKGIIHRDLKPANIKLTTDDRVKVLDFGLAKAMTDDSSPNATMSPTMTAMASRLGVIVGTAAYMAPEQAKGKAVDKRVDIWAFGCVLYEMLTGTRAFAGDDVTDFIVSVMTKEPDWAKLPVATPSRIVGLLKRCLKKDPRERLRDVGDARFELLDREAGRTAPPASANAARRERWVAVALAVALAAVASFVVASVYFRSPPRSAPLIRLQLLPPENTTFGALALSPDGRRLAFTAVDAAGQSRLFVRQLDSLSAQTLPDTEGASYPFWAPDSRLIGFFTDGQVKKIDSSGGRPQTLCSFPAGRGGASGGTWNPDGVILFAFNQWSPAPLYRVSASGGESRPATTLDLTRHEESHLWPTFLADGKHFLYLVTTTQGDNAAHTAIHLGTLDGQETRRLLVAPASVVYARSVESKVATDYLLFVRDRALLAQAFDVDRLQTIGDPVTIDQDVGVDLSASFRSRVSVGAGVLVHMSGDGTNQLAWFDRAGKRLESLGPPGLNIDFRLSPDGRRVAVQREDGLGSSDIWLVDAERAVSSRLTFHPAYEAAPVWSPDGESVAFFSTRDGPWSIYEKSSTGTGDERLLAKSNDNLVPDDWSPDGTFLLYQNIALNGGERGDDLWLLPRPDSRASQSRPIPFLRSEFGEYWGRFSPDGRWIAYQSNESGRSEVYVRPFRPESAGSGKWQISTDGGVEARWSRDGRELFYLTLRNVLVAVDVHPGPSFQAGVPRPLFSTRAVGINRYDVARDAKRFLINVPVEGQWGRSATVVLNWMEMIKRTK